MRPQRLMWTIGVAVLAAACCSAVLLRHVPRTASSPLASATPPTAMFREIAVQSGLSFRYDNGHQGIATIMEESGSGCAIFDYDGDGWPDLYLLNGRDLYGRGIQTRNALYHNNQDGTFTDVTEKAGVPGTGYGLGVAAADFDNDGHPDLYICQWGKNVLYHNNGDGTFSDITDKAGVGGADFGGSFHTGVAWLDYDHDGYLDLFVCGYVRFQRDWPRSRLYCKLANGILSNCPPSMYDGTPSILYHNNHNGTFTNVTKQAHVYFPNGKALSALTCDFDDNGWTDLFVGNDGEEAWLLRNRGDGTFSNVASAMGVAFAQDGATMAAMGVDMGDYRNEGQPGLFVADFSKRPDHLWRGMQGGFFSEVSAPAGIADPTFNYLGFGAGFFDYDNDGWLDIFVTNGHVYPEVEQSGTDEHYLQINQLFHNSWNGTFRETTSEAGPALQVKHAGRGVAFGDIDNDGAMDILVNNNDGPPVLLRNQAARNHFIEIRLEGTRSNRDAIGARVWLSAGGLRQMRDVKNGGSYLSCSDPRLHFGLGTTARVDRLEIRWPSGLRQSIGPLPADSFYVMREGAPSAQAQAFHPAIAERRP